MALVCEFILLTANKVYSPHLDCPSFCDLLLILLSFGPPMLTISLRNVDALDDNIIQALFLCSWHFMFMKTKDLRVLVHINRKPQSEMDVKYIHQNRKRSQEKSHMTSSTEWRELKKNQTYSFKCKWILKWISKHETYS